MDSSFRYRRLALIAVLAVAPIAVTAQETPAAPATNTMLNTPDVTKWNVYGPGQTHKLHKDAVVQGGGAMRIDVTAKPAAIYEIGAAAPITGAIAKGDRLIAAFWVRLLDADAGATAQMPAMIQLNSAPYSPVLTGSVTVTSEWKLVSIKGIAPSDHAAGTTNVNLHLGAAPQTFDLGPAFVMKL